MKKKIVSVLVVSLILISMTVSAAGGCGHWEYYDVGTPYCIQITCDDENAAYMQSLFKKRTCVRPDNTVYDYDSKCLGCGC